MKHLNFKDARRAFSLDQRGNFLSWTFSSIGPGLMWFRIIRKLLIAYVNTKKKLQHLPIDRCHLSSKMTLKIKDCVSGQSGTKSQRKWYLGNALFDDPLELCLSSGSW